MKVRNVLYCLALSLSTLPSAARADVSLAGTRTQYFMNEPVELAVSGNARSLEVRHSDGSNLAIVVPAGSGTRLITIKPNTLKPGEYTASDGTAQNAGFGVHRGEHPNAYFTGQWVHHGGTAQNAAAKGGWMYFNSDYVSLHSRPPKPGDLEEAYVAARMRPYALMILGGGHQLDLDLANDWGDPWVQRAVYWRMNLGALSNRIYPMAGLHTYDEPGLTWWPVPTGATNEKGEPLFENSPYAIPHQLEEFKKLTGKEIPYAPFSKVAPTYANDMEAWIDFMGMRMKYLEQAWWANVQGTEAVNPNFTTLNQVSSSYAPGDVPDGVDTRQARPYKVVSGHGGYSDLPFGTFQPVQSAESFRGFTWDRPHYYLPMWYVHTWSSMRNAIWLSWTTKLEGMLYTPEQDFAMDAGQMGFHGTNTIFEIADINRRLALVGDVMNKLPKTPSPVAVLLSYRQAAYDVAANNHPEVSKIGVPHYISPHRDAVSLTFWRVMETGVIPNWVDEYEATEKGGSFLKQWKVIFLPRLTTISPALRKALEEYMAGGGKLIQNKGDKLILPGAIVADHEFGNPTTRYTEADIEHNPAQGHDLAWRAWNNSFAPNFARDLESWIGTRPYRSSNAEVFVNPHRTGNATYLLIANNAQSKENPRGIKHELIPAATTISIPRGGVVYDAFNGGIVPVANGQAQLKLAAGDGACLVHVAAAPGPIKVTAVQQGAVFPITVTRSAGAPLPFRLRVFSPSGDMADELYRATTPQGKNTSWSTRYALGANAAPGSWTVEAYEWLTGTKSVARVLVKPQTRGEWSTLETKNVSIYFDDARRIRDLFAGKVSEPDYAKMNWDSKRVFGLDAKKFAVFGEESVANQIAAALRAKGLNVDVNPKYEIVPFKREPNRGGAGPIFREANFENIYAHTIVLPGHALATQSFNRGHINRPVTKDFPGPGRAYIQWGQSAYQASWQNVWVFGDTDAGVKWLLTAISGSQGNDGDTAKNLVTTTQVPASKAVKPRSLVIAQQVKTGDAPVGIGSSPDGKVLYVLQADGSVAANDRTGKVLWQQQALLIGNDLAVNPRGDRVAVAGYPGLQVLDAASGKVLGGYRAPALPWAVSRPLMTRLAWSDNGQVVAAGWADNYKDYDKAASHLPAVVVDAGGQVVKEIQLPGDVMGAVFVPQSETVLLGAEQLTAANARSGEVLWRADIKGAQGFAFAPDAKSVAAGGWGKTAGVVNLADGKVVRQAKFDAVVGGVSLLPNGDLVAAVWGGTKPLYVVRGNDEKPQTFYQSRFAFQSVAWAPMQRALVAAEQGGDVWLLDASGKVLARRTDAGTTAYRMVLQGIEVLLARQNRVAQRISLK